MLRNFDLVQFIILLWNSCITCSLTMLLSSYNFSKYLNRFLLVQSNKKLFNKRPDLMGLIDWIGSLRNLLKRARRNISRSKTFFLRVPSTYLSKDFNQYRGSLIYSVSARICFFLSLGSWLFWFVLNCLHISFSFIFLKKKFGNKISLRILLSHR